MDTTFLNFVVMSLIFFFASDNFLSDYNILKREHSMISDDWPIKFFGVSWKFYQFPLFHSSCESHVQFLQSLYPLSEETLFLQQNLVCNIISIFPELFQVSCFSQYFHNFYNELHISCNYWKTQIVKLSCMILAKIFHSIKMCNLSSDF